jgi:hypothetical protein
MKCLLLVIFLALTSLTMPALAQTDCTIEVGPGDNPLSITGRLGEENSFVGNLRLTAPCEEGVERFSFLVSDLERNEGDNVIGRQNVTLIGDPKLEANVPKDFQVRVSGATVPGTYLGTMYLLQPGQALSEAQAVDMQIIAKVQPTLMRVPSTGPVQLSLVNCGSGLDCPIAGLVLHNSAFLDETAVRFHNPAQAPVTVTAARAVVMEEQNPVSVDR